MEIFAIDQLTPIWSGMMKNIVQERERYSQIYEVIETYAASFVGESISANKKIILGGTMGVNLLLGKQRDIEDYSYEFYTEDSFYHANALTNKIAEVLPISNVDEKPLKIVVLRSVIPYYKYYIVIDGRTLVVIFDIGSNRNKEQSVSSIKVIEPVVVKNFSGNLDILVLPPEMQLIDIYRTLCSPNKAGDWEKALRDENQLFNLMLTNIRDTSRKGGDEVIDITSKQGREKIQTVILKDFVQNNIHCALLGEHALFTTDGEQSEIKSFIIQIISDREPEEDFRDVTKILHQKLGPYMPISKYTRNLHIMQDFRLSRTVIKIGDAKSGEQKEILYIYNSAKYDLVPFNRFLSDNSFLQIGNPFILLRFLLIDFWIIKWIFASGGIDEKYSKLRQNSIREKILMLRSRLSTGSKITTINNQYVLHNSNMRVFQDNSTEYLGKYENEEISQKEKAKDISRRYFDYFPQEYFSKNNEYRNISDG
jgi:hypothetical protein